MNVELLTVSIGIGLVVSLLLGEVFGLTAGGMIVPGYVALYLERPLDIALTLMGALVTFVIVSGLASVAIIYGRRRTALTILVGYLVGVAIQFVLGGVYIPAADVSVIGFIIPGLIAIWFQRQGVIETTTALLTGAVVVRLTLIVLMGS